MAPKRNTRWTSRSVPYDVNLPDNWTAKKLRQELNELGTFPVSSAKKSELIKLYKDRVNSAEPRPVSLPPTREPAVTIPSAPDIGRILRHDTAQHAIASNNQDGGPTVMSAGSELTATILALREDIKHMQERLQTVENRHVPAAAAGSSLQTPRDAMISQGRSASLPVSVTETNNQASRESVGQSYSDTGFGSLEGISSEDLPQVELIAPNIRKNILEDEKIPQISPISRKGFNTLPTVTQPPNAMRNQINQLWDAAISPQTARAYTVAIQHLLRFVTLFGTRTPCGQLPALSEDLLMYFVSYCYHSLKLKFATINLYLAGIRFHYIKAGYANPFLNSERLSCILRGIKRKQGTDGITKPQRLPITFDILRRMSTLLLSQRSVFSPVLDLMLTCVCQMAFFGFLRCGEFTIKNKSVAEDCLRLNDIVIADDKSKYTLLLRASKTDPFRQGVPISIFKNSRWWVCPVTSMLRFLDIRRSQGARGQSPLFVVSSGVPLTRDQFIVYLRHVLTLLGIDSSKYNGHSFRIGAATSAAAAGIEDHMIQTLGRWSSNCYTRYIRSSSEVIQEAQSKMSSF
ncbi:uncharacterized protein LOC132558244 [Ylistrum balloti]|uniref:uncharacterized protein LOC132558244 n=1 Tax=Ylistrum balloti TaxID=509963 RepID=UPI0029058B5B|nr:uncharacterized protein LOC132558244 [Ylistrum balloti]